MSALVLLLIAAFSTSAGTSTAPRGPAAGWPGRSGQRAQQGAWRGWPPELRTVGHLTLYAGGAEHLRDDGPDDAT